MRKGIKASRIIQQGILDAGNYRLNLKEEFIKMKLLKRLFREEEGASMVEYALLVALIAVVVLAALGPLGTAIRALFQRVTGNISAV